MTTVLVKQKTLELATAEIQEYLRRRGVEVSGFGPTDWLADWLNDSAGSFWGRKIKVPVVGDVCRTKVESCEKKDGIWFSKGRIAETRCWIKGAERLDNEAKVKVVATTESGVECVVANAEDKLSSLEFFLSNLLYRAWRNGRVGRSTVAAGGSETCEDRSE